MPNFAVSTRTFSVRPVKQDEIVPVQTMRRGPDSSYQSLPDGPRQYNARLAVGGARAAVVSQAMGMANEHSLSVWLKKWLDVNETKIQEALLSNGHSAFALQVNYAVGNSFGNRMFMSRDIYLLGTVPTKADIGTILTNELMFGPKVDAVPNNATKFQYAYLVGERL
ncbi:hypothetical protein G6L28_18615 [Agrobacterium larrymoorei]|uniref:hypothetical protein n=1 Tax=Agrobacterium larrymoorei TaxID=160699 RepID=UPI0015716199|nr:hypothetical protein [Agrobacterium larrymoorei]NTJ44611.1 hypothetical protein [Agrobacterium larrymoorei]